MACAFFNFGGEWKHLVLKLQGHLNVGTSTSQENEYRFAWWCIFHIFHDDYNDDEKHVDIMIEVHKFESIYQRIEEAAPKIPNERNLLHVDIDDDQINFHR